MHFLKDDNSKPTRDRSTDLRDNSTTGQLTTQPKGEDNSTLAPNLKLILDRLFLYLTYVPSLYKF